MANVDVDGIVAMVVNGTIRGSCDMLLAKLSLDKSRMDEVKLLLSDKEWYTQMRNSGPSAGFWADDEFMRKRVLRGVAAGAFTPTDASKLLYYQVRYAVFIVNIESVVGFTLGLELDMSSDWAQGVVASAIRNAPCTVIRLLHDHGFNAKVGPGSFMSREDWKEVYALICTLGMIDTVQTTQQIATALVSEKNAGQHAKWMELDKMVKGLSDVKMSLSRGIEVRDVCGYAVRNICNFIRRAAKLDETRMQIEELSPSGRYTSRIALYTEHNGVIQLYEPSSVL